MSDERPAYERASTDDLDLLLSALPPQVRQPLESLGPQDELLEIVLDLGREPEARFVGREVVLAQREVSPEDLEYVVTRVGAFGADNRAGIPRTLHRISALRNRKGAVVGLTCRVGRSVRGTVEIVRDLVAGGQSVLILGRPGWARPPSCARRAGARGRHPAPGGGGGHLQRDRRRRGHPPPRDRTGRRLQVPTPARQHAVMIEAVENHMPEVMVIDEIGTEREAAPRAPSPSGGAAGGHGARGHPGQPAPQSDAVRPGGGHPAGDPGGRGGPPAGGRRRRSWSARRPHLRRAGGDAGPTSAWWCTADVAETVDALLRGQSTAVELRSGAPTGRSSGAGCPGRDDLGAGRAGRRWPRWPRAGATVGRGRGRP